MNLLIDAGNSRVKWAFDGPGVWKTALCARAEFAQSLEKSLRDTSKISDIVISSTRNRTYNQQLSVLLGDLFDIEPYFIESGRREHGVINRYQPPGALGVDRWASLIAVRSLGTSPAVVIDAGTAVTVDALSAEGMFEGGVIFPGISLAVHSLDKADNLSVADQVNPSVFAQSTEQAMYSGVLYSIAAGIDGIVVRMRKSLGYSVNVYLSGGDADTLAGLLEHHVIKEPDLVLKGVKIIADSRK